MCRIAFRDVPGAEVSDYEITRGGTSYTYLTCRHFKAEDPKGNFSGWSARICCAISPPGGSRRTSCKTRRSPSAPARKRRAGRKRRKRRLPPAFRSRLPSFPTKGKRSLPPPSGCWRRRGRTCRPIRGKRSLPISPGKACIGSRTRKRRFPLEKPSRRAHSIRVAFLAAERAKPLGVDEKRAVTAALFHDCAKNLPPDSPYLSGFLPPPRRAGPRSASVRGRVCRGKIGGDGRRGAGRDPLPHERQKGDDRRSGSSSFWPIFWKRAELTTAWTDCAPVCQGEGGDWTSAWRNL